MCFDAPRSRTLLFGGQTQSGVVGDTWQLAANGWTQIADTGPAARTSHAMCFDSATGVALLYGGAAGGPFGDTWALSEADWTQVEDSGPGTRLGHALAFDVKRKRAILFGGTGAAGLTADTWQWTPATGKWTQIADTGPTRRQHHCMAYDLVNERVVLFGGADSNGTSLGDTWALEGDAWTHIAHFGAPASARVAMVGSDVGLTLFGGLASGPQPAPLAGTWRFAANRWTQRQDIGPSPRGGHAMAFDTSRRAVIVFGGSAPPEIADAAERLFADTWEHLETEPSVAPGPGPEPDPNPNPNHSIPSVAGLDAQPSTTPAGGQVTITVTLDGPSQATLVVRTAWVLQSVFDASNNNGQPPQPGDVHFLPDLQIPAGLTQGTFGLVAPAVNEPSIVVLAATDNGVVATVVLTIN
jgi:hypothetical protein